MAKSILYEPIANKYILIKIISHDNVCELHFKVKFLTKMKKLKKTYCDRLGVSESSISLFYNGTLIKDEDTPETLQMKNVDVISVYQEVL
jgi:small ubiquitin-related modifier